MRCAKPVVAGEHWTGSPKKSIDQIGKNCPKIVRKLCFRPLWTIFGHFSDIFSTFFGHFVGIPFFWAVQRSARYNAKGIFAKGIWGCTGFSLLRWEKGSETPCCDGEKGLRRPRSLGRSRRNKAVSDPFPHRKTESQTLSPNAKRSLRPFPPPQKENPVHPQIPLAKIPLAQRMKGDGAKVTEPNLR